MKLKGLFLIEIAFLLGILIFSAVYFLSASSFGSSGLYQSIDVYSQQSDPVRYLSIDKGQIALVRFNYTSYDPAIIVIDFDFNSIKSPGKLDVLCNYKPVTTLYVTPEKPVATLNLVSFSGLDWVEPMTAMFGLNDLVFESNDIDGFVGDFSYQISFRGSR